mgnify:CR=1 FL=1
MLGIYDDEADNDPELLIAETFLPAPESVHNLPAGKKLSFFPRVVVWFRELWPAIKK